VKWLHLAAGLLFVVIGVLLVVKTIRAS
jgi:hypothetical protein